MPLPDTPVKNSSLHIARNGQILGIYEADKVADQLESGFLLASDFYYDEDQGEWQPLSAWNAREKIELQPLPSDPPPSRAPEIPRKPKRRNGGSKARAKRKSEGTLVGWVACLFAIGVAAGLWVWAQNLNDRLQAADEKVKNLNETVATLIKQAEVLTEMTPPGHLRAVVTYEPGAGKIAIMSGVTIGIYKRADIESLVEKVAEENRSRQDSAQGFDDSIEHLFSTLPSPSKISLTNADGRVDIALGEPGDYVLVSSATKKTGSASERLLWITSFRSGDQPSLTILLNERNAITLKNPQFFIRNGDRMAAGLN